MNYTHAIITYSKIHYLLTAEKQNELLDKRADEIIMIDGSPVKVNNICDILTISKYYEAYPDKRPPVTNRFKEVPGMGFGGLLNTSRETALKGIIGGLKNFLSGKGEDECKASRELLSTAEKRLMQVNNN